MKVIKKKNPFGQISLTGPFFRKQCWKLAVFRLSHLALTSTSHREAAVHTKFHFKSHGIFARQVELARRRPKGCAGQFDLGPTHQRKPC